jgi:hypothetical protein
MIVVCLLVDGDRPIFLFGVALRRAGWRICVIGLWMRSYWRFDQFIHSVSATDYFACTSIQGEIQMGMSNEPALRAAFRQDTWIRKEFAMVDWQKALDGPEAYFPASSPGPFIAPTVRMPRFTKRSFVTSTPSDTAYQIIIPYWLLFFFTLAVAALPWIRWSKRFSLRIALFATTLVAVVLGTIMWSSR